jgi:NAD+ synthase
MYERIKTAEKRNALINTITTDIAKHIDVAVIGMSGGADSTLLTILCSIALGEENVFGLGMPYNATDEYTFNDRSTRLANQIGVNYDTLSIGPTVDTFASMFGEMSELNQGNLRSRMRMLTLYSHACRIGEEQPGKKVRVIGTGNRSEDYIGYDTKGGDALADIFPIGELYKREVYALLDHFVAEGRINGDLIDRTPSAGLWDGQTDEGELGHTYDEMAPAIDFCMRNVVALTDGTIKPPDEITEFVWTRHITNKHKHEAPYVSKL